MISHLLLDVADLQRMTAFYRDVLGFEVVYEEPGTCAFLRLGEGPTIGLYPGRKGTDPGPWLVAVDVDDLEAAIARLAGHGVQVGPVQEIPFARIALFRDPEGNRLELHQPR